MAVTGLIMIGYLLAHMYGNLKVFAGEAAFNEYAHHLRILGEPLLPRSGALWVFRVVLLASVLGHMFAAFNLWARAQQGPRRRAPATRASGPGPGCSGPTPRSPCAGAGWSSRCS